MKPFRYIVAANLLLAQCLHVQSFAPPASRIRQNPALPNLQNTGIHKNAPETFHTHPPNNRRGDLCQRQAAVGLLPALRSLHSNTSYVLSAILWLSTFGISLEKRTTIGKALSAPLATMALALVTANVGLLPFSSPVCEFYIQ